MATEELLAAVGDAVPVLDGEAEELRARDDVDDHLLDVAESLEAQATALDEAYRGHGATTPELAEAFNRRHDPSLLAQALKVAEEGGEVAEAVLGHVGELLFKDSHTADDVGDELADLVATTHYVADLVGVDDLEERARERMVENIMREAGP